MAKAKQKIYTALGIVLGFAGTVACAGDGNNAPPQTPAGVAGVTTTTGGTTDYSPSEPSVTSMSRVGRAGTSETAPTDSTATDDLPSRSPMSRTAGTRVAGASAVTTESAASSLNDAQIVGIIHAADAGEVAQADAALVKAKDARVKHFAERMRKGHSVAESTLSSIESKAGIIPRTSMLADYLKTSGAGVASRLRSATGVEFDQAYVDVQVKEHAAFLDLLDNKLIPRAQDADLAQNLQELRVKVAGDLRDAQEVQTALQSQ